MMSFPRILLMLFAALAVGGALAACGGGDNSNGSAKTAAPTSHAATATTKPSGAAATTKPAGATSPAASGAAQTVKVTAKDFSFDPASVEAPANKPVTFQLTNSGSATHTLTIYEDDAYTKPVSGASVQATGGKQGEFTVTFPKAGEYYFRCEIHHQMTGEIKVQ